MAIIDQVTLRTGVADWLNRSDLTDAQLDDFISIGEARIYEALRVPTLEVIQSFSVTSTNSSIIIPAGLLEVKEIKLDATDKDDDVVLSRVDSKTFTNNKISHAYTRAAGNFLLTDKSGNQEASGTYTITYYKADDPIGTYSSTATTAGSFVVGKYYTILTVGNTSFTGIGASANTVGIIFKATGVGSGTGTANVETIPWILGTEFETILFAAGGVGSTFLGDTEMEEKFNGLSANKIKALNDKETRASMKGGAFHAAFSDGLL